MTNEIKSETSQLQPESGQPRAGWFRLGIVAAASVLAGGMAAAWWYRKTLNKLHESGENSENPQFGIPEGSPTEDSYDEI